jgi:hypothetical protein
LTVNGQKHKSDNIWSFMSINFFIYYLISNWQLTLRHFILWLDLYLYYQPSVTTNEIDKAVHQMIIDAGAYPSPLGYGGFPKSVCTSVNECMCHGIPDSRQLQVLLSLFFNFFYPCIHITHNLWQLSLFAEWWYYQHWCYSLPECMLLNSYWYFSWNWPNIFSCLDVCYKLQQYFG